MYRLLLLSFALGLSACAGRGVDEPSLDAGGVDRPDASGAVGDAGEPDAGVSPDGGMSPDAGPQCPPGTVVEAGACVDIDECAESNGGCGDPVTWTCVNRYAGPPQCLFDCAPDQRALMDGVDEFRMGERVWPSALVVHGAQACPLIHNNQSRVVVASARLGAGRIVQTGHQHPINRDLLADGHAGATLVRNAVAWMTAHLDRIELRIGRHPQQFSAAVNLLAGDGHGVSALHPTAEGLAEVDVYFFNSRNDYSEDETDALNAFVRAGGGLISSGQAWSWSGSAQAAVTNFPGNRAILGSGLTVTKANQNSGDLPVSAEPLGTGWHARYALYAAERHFNGERLLSNVEQALVGETVGFAVQHLPFALSSYYDPVVEVVRATDPIVPTVAEKVRPEEVPMDLLLMHLMDIVHRYVAPEFVADFVADWDFPGLPQPDSARHQVTIDLVASYAGRSANYNYSGARKPLIVPTGAYAMPGEVIEVTVPADAAGRGLGVQIGTHSDKLWGKDAIERFPQVIRTDRLTESVTRSASAFGGPVYITVPVGSEVGEISVTVGGVILAPFYQHGVTRPEEWARQLDEHPAPWAEIQGEKFGFAVQTEEARAIPDIVALILFWDGVMDAYADLEGSGHERVRRERFTLDRQISAGALHSGYPVMGHLSHHRGLLDLEHIRQSGSWGPFHELGHNHQWRDWFLPGTTEATCNLWSVYIHSEVLGLPTLTEGRVGPDDRRQRRQAYLDGGPNFDADWSVWVALDTYLQLQEAFGWELFSTVFADYRRDSDAASGSAQDRIDEWVLRTSGYAQRNLIPFYRAWGFPISEDVVATVSTWPDWVEDPMR
jgi:hypothetical protein